MLKCARNMTLCLLIVFGLGGCETITEPVPWGIELLPEGTPTFQAGWKHGCETGLSVYGNDRYKAVYQWQQDPKMVLNDEYYRAWKDSYTYCRWYANTWVRSAKK